MITAKTIQAGIDKGQLELGEKVEEEHKPTYQMIEKTVKETGKMPPPKKVYKSITEDHLDENPDDYYEESDQAKKDRLVVPKESSMIVQSFIVHLPGHKDSKGNIKPWAIRSHKNNKILGSYGSRPEAEKALRRMRYFKHHGSAMIGLKAMSLLKHTFMGDAMKELGMGE